MLKRRHISLRHWLARGLLVRVARLVSDTVLYALVIYSIGCVIPTPLDQAPEHPNVGGPTLITSAANPPFGMITHASTDPFDLNITITDPDVGDSDSQDEIWARLYRVVGGMPLHTEEIQLLGTDSNNPHIRSGTFSELARCGAYGLGGGAITDLYVIVSDRKFTPMTEIGTDGLFDTNHWDLTCL